MSAKISPPETTLNHLLKAWHENNGNWLLAVGFIVAVMACVVGYLDIIPDISTTARTGNPSLMLSGKLLTVEVTGCRSDEGQVVAMLYEGDNFSENSVAIRIQNLEINDGKAVWAIHNLPYGRYAVYAFHDIDVNDTVDPNLEPQGLSLAIKRSDAAKESQKLEYADAVFDFSANHESIIVKLR